MVADTVQVQHDLIFIPEQRRRVGAWARGRAA